MITEKIKETKETNNRKELRFISLCSDTTFKYLYKNPDTRGWFNHIIKEKFNLDLEDYSIVDNELNTGNFRKDYRLDLRLEKEDIVVIIEMNQDYYDFLEIKNYQYLYRVAGNRFDQGESYRSKPTKLVLFNEFKNPKDPTNKTGNYLLMDPNTQLVIDDIESFEIYLPNFKNVCYDNEVEVSLSLFTQTSYDDMRKLTKNPEDLKIIEKLEELAMNEAFLFDYDHERVMKKTENSIREESYEKGLTKGIEEGSHQEKVEIAKNLLKMKMIPQDIANATGLSIEEIESIQK